MIIYILITSLFIVFLLFQLYKPIREYLHEKRVYTSCFKMPLIGYVPILGHYLLLNGTISKQEHFRRLLAFQDELPNEPVLCMYFLFWPLLMFSRADYLEAFFAAGSKHTTKSVDYHMLHDWLKGGLLVSSGQKWKTRRRILTPSFHDHNLLANAVDTFNNQMNIFIEKFKVLADQGIETNAYKHVSAYTLDVICESAMGRSIGIQTQESEYGNAVLRIGDLIVHRMRSPWLWPRPLFSLTAIGREHDHLLKIIHKFTRQVIEDRITEYDTANVKPRMAFLDTLISKMNEDQLTLDDVQEEVDTFMFEGHDTTGTNLYFALFLIAANPHVQQLLFKEVFNIFGHDVERACTMDDLKQMDYLERVLKEALRLMPSVPVIGREIHDDFEYDGKTFFKGTMVLIFIYAIHRDPRFFPDPEKFDPDRFLPESMQHWHPYTYIPFSAGSRNCIGQRFAMMEEKVFLSTVIRNFELSTSQTYNDLAPTIELVIRSATELKIKVKRRNYSTI